MAKFSIITIQKEYDGLVDGNWVQNHIGTLESAKIVADNTSKVNSGAPYAVIDELNTPVPILSYWTGMRRLA